RRPRLDAAACIAAATANPSCGAGFQPAPGRCREKHATESSFPSARGSSLPAPGSIRIPARLETNMRIGVPTEIKDNEFRVGMTPAGAAVLSSDGHQVLIQKGAGNGSGFADDEYVAAGAKILPDADAVYDQAEMIVKVKEPIDPDLKRLKDGQLL